MHLKMKIAEITITKLVKAMHVNMVNKLVLRFVFMGTVELIIRCAL